MAKTTADAAAPAPPPFLVAFYDPHVQERDDNGRRLVDILNWTDQRLEVVHDYIQVLFPLPERSFANWDAPLIDRATRDAFAARSDLRLNVRRAFERMLAFYGFGIVFDEGNLSNWTVEQAPNFAAAANNWVVRVDHNHLRITRILRSLRVLGLEREATEFYAALLQVGRDCPGRISERSFAFWRRAAERELYLPPDVDENDVGVRWLRE